MTEQSDEGSAEKSRRDKTPEDGPDESSGRHSTASDTSDSNTASDSGTTSDTNTASDSSTTSDSGTANDAQADVFAKTMTESFDNASRMAEQFFETNSSAMADFFKKSQRVLTESMSPPTTGAANELDPMNVAPAFRAAGEKLALDPQKLVQSNYSLWNEHMELWQSTIATLLAEQDRSAEGREKSTQGKANEPVADKRFRDENWSKHPMFDYIRRSYLITARWMVETMASIEGLDPADRDKLLFHTKLLADAFSPSNFMMTNPQALQTMMDTGGQSVVQGLKNLQRDLDPSTGQLKILMNDPDAFRLGENIATTPGKVVWQNDLLQLIQYSPTTKTVHARPLVIVPPWINKFYILDLQKKNSFIAWAVGQGYTVYVISWVNPDGALGAKTFEDYMQEGILDTLDAVEAASGSREVTMIGYCIGGTLLSATLARMAVLGDDRVKAATFFASQADFSEAGDLKLFTDEAQVDRLERMMKDKGYLEGSSMSTTFNLLRANDLIWSFYVDNYLLGKEPLKFDLLYWNADSTRMPRETHLFYLRNMYIRNLLSKPGGIVLQDVPIDLSKVTIPVYLQAAREDHIAPYPSVFKSAGLYSGPVRFVLAGSGHIAGVINPPAANKYQHWLNEAAPKSLDDWMAGAVEQPGSWWEDWDRWLAPLSGDDVPARIPGDGAFEPIEDAPGSYVRVKS